LLKIEILTRFWIFNKKTSSEKGRSMGKHFDMGSMIVIIVTFILFIAALFTKGFTHDLLLEAGVFLVSVKLILMAFKNSNNVKIFQKELQEIKEILKEKQ
jgi:flagellar motor component MotA